MEPLWVLAQNAVLAARQRGRLVDRLVEFADRDRSVERFAGVFHVDEVLNRASSQNACPGRAGWGKPGQSAVLWASFLL